MEVSQPDRVLATAEFKVHDRTRSELKANSLSAGCWRTSTRNFSNTRAGFPSQRFLATPPFLIPPAPAASHSETRCLRMGKSLLLTPLFPMRLAGTNVEDMSLTRKERQVVSRKRVTDHGEVYTAKREVNAMLDLVKQETTRIDSRFLEPACGKGNFLTEILERKLHVVERVAARVSWITNGMPFWRCPQSME